MEPWTRYGSLVDDVARFREACERPLPTAVRVNPVKATPTEAMTALEDEGLVVEQRDWSPHTLLLETGSPGRTWAYQHGWVHGQEEISQLPPRVLNPDPEAVVLDVAAAPGGKATQLSAMVDPPGFVIGNDVNLGRLTALRANADRLGIMNMAVTNQDGRSFSTEDLGIETVDATLVDAPCSGEGTIRKQPGVIDEWSLEAVKGLSSVQAALLRRAVQLTRPGGTVVYATCTFAPEENEAVLSEVLATEACSIEPFTTDLRHDPGVTEWEGASYDPAVRHAKRFYPHQNDTGGFVCAKLRVES